MKANEATVDDFDTETMILTSINTITTHALCTMDRTCRLQIDNYSCVRLKVGKCSVAMYYVSLLLCRKWLLFF